MKVKVRRICSRHKREENARQEEFSKNVIMPESKDNKEIKQELKVGEWFRIDREIIEKNQNEIRRQCEEAGAKGIDLWKRFEVSNEIANRYPTQYPRLIETFIFEHDWKGWITLKEMQDMCKAKGDGMCCMVICDLELQMRICNGELVDDLVNKPDKLPRVRLMNFRNENIGYLGGGVEDGYDLPPANIYGWFHLLYPNSEIDKYTPYAFRRVLT